MLDAAVAAKSASPLSPTVALSLSLSLSSFTICCQLLFFFLRKKEHIFYLYLYAIFFSFCQAIAMVFIDMVKERNFINKYLCFCSNPIICIVSVYICIEI